MFGRCEQFFHRFDGTFDWKLGCLGKSELKKWRSRLFEDEIAEFLDEIQEYAKH